MQTELTNQVSTLQKVIMQALIVTKTVQRAKRDKKASSTKSAIFAGLVFYF